MAESRLKLLRPDGRSNQDLRQLCISFPGLARVDGSAYFSFGGSPALSLASTGANSGSLHKTATTNQTATSAIASLTGPAEVRLASEHPSQLTFEVLLRPFCGVPATESKALAANVRHILGTSLIWGANPRTLVQMVVQVLGSSWAADVKRGIVGDAVMATAVNAGMLALMNAGSVPLTGVVCAVAVGRQSDGVLLLDPGEDEEGDLSATGCFAFIFSSFWGPEGAVGRCVWTNWRAIGKGRFDGQVLREAREIARRAAGEVYTEMKNVIEDTAERPAVEEKPVRKGKGRDMTETIDPPVQPDSDDNAQEDEDEDDNKMEI